VVRTEYVDSNQKTTAVKHFITTYESISLDSVLLLVKTTIDNYSNVTFVIRRKPKHYQVTLKGDCLD
jgi:hypothetical protein